MNGPDEREQKAESSTAPGAESFEDAHLTDFEQALTRAMKRVELRAETTKKFLALAEEAERNRVHAGSGFGLIKLSNGGRVFAMPRPRAWMGGAIAAVLAMGIFVGTHVHEEHERRVEAQKQFETAERITDQTLARTREELARQGIELEQ
jgi:hypothetical protein